MKRIFNRLIEAQTVLTASVLGRLLNYLRSWHVVVTAALATLTVSK